MDHAGGQVRIAPQPIAVLLHERSAVRVTQPDWVDAHCARQVVLRTNYRSAQPAPPPSEQPYPKDGVAVSPAHAIEPIDIVAAAAPVLPADDLRT